MAKITKLKGQAPKQIDLESRRRYALELRLLGLNYDTIAERVRMRFPQFPNYSKQRVTDDLHGLLDRAYEENRELGQVAKELELQRLDQLWAIGFAHCLNGDVRVIQQLISISNQRCNLLGLFPKVDDEVERGVESELGDLLSVLSKELPEDDYRNVLQIVADNAKSSK